MLISELIEELQKFQKNMGDLPVVLNDGLGSKVDVVFWDEDDNEETVIAIAS